MAKDAAWGARWVAKRVLTLNDLTKGVSYVDKEFDEIYEARKVRNA